MIVFGGLKGLEYSLDADEHLMISAAELLFDHYVNTCPTQGSRTIRTEVSQSGKIQSGLLVSVESV